MRENPPIHEASVEACHRMTLKDGANVLLMATREEVERMGTRLSEIWSSQQQFVEAIAGCASQGSARVRDILAHQFGLAKEQMARIEDAAGLLGTLIEPADYGIMAKVLEEGVSPAPEAGIDREILSLARVAKNINIREFGRARVLADELGVEEVAEVLETCLTKEYVEEEAIVREMNEMTPG